MYLSNIILYSIIEVILALLILIVVLLYNGRKLRKMVESLKEHLLKRKDAREVHSHPSESLSISVSGNSRRPEVHQPLPEIDNSPAGKPDHELDADVNNDYAQCLDNALQTIERRHHLLTDGSDIRFDPYDPIPMRLISLRHACITAERQALEENSAEGESWMILEGNFKRILLNHFKETQGIDFSANEALISRWKQAEDSNSDYNLEMARLAEQIPEVATLQEKQKRVQQTLSSLINEFTPVTDGNGNYTGNSQAIPTGKMAESRTSARLQAAVTETERLKVVINSQQSQIEALKRKLYLDSDQPADSPNSSDKDKRIEQFKRNEQELNMCVQTLEADLERAQLELEGHTARAKHHDSQGITNAENLKKANIQIDALTRALKRARSGAGQMQELEQINQQFAKHNEELLQSIAQLQQDNIEMQKRIASQR